MNRNASLGGHPAWQVEGRLRPPTALKESRSSTGRETSELFTDTAYDRFRGGRNCRHRYPTLSETEGHRQYTLWAFA
jgi:hypothetical protein